MIKIKSVIAVKDYKINQFSKFEYIFYFVQIDIIMAVLSRYQQKVHASLFAIHPFWVPDYLAILVMAPCYIEISQIFGIYPVIYLSIYPGIYFGIYLLFILVCILIYILVLFWYIPWHPGIYSVTYPDILEYILVYILVSNNILI